MTGSNAGFAAGFYHTLRDGECCKTLVRRVPAYCEGKGVIVVAVFARSLSRTIDSADDRFQRCIEIPSDEREKLIEWLLDRQVLSGRNAGAFAPTAGDFSRGTHLYTGERLHTKVATWTVLTAEAARFLVLLGGTGEGVSPAIERARNWLAVSCFGARDCVVGECAHSFVAHLRFLNTTGADRAAVVRRVSVLRTNRDDAGRWRRFPFYYTVMVLSEIACEAARSELRYAVAAWACRRVWTRHARDGLYGVRRRALLERIIAQDDRGHP
ncbi:MAG: hypothetical protein WBC63_09090 [Candidatus Bipolaricaulia bacterium]